MLVGIKNKAKNCFDKLPEIVKYFVLLIWLYVLICFWPLIVIAVAILIDCYVKSTVGFWLALVTSLIGVRLLLKNLDTMQHGNDSNGRLIRSCFEQLEKKM